MAQSDGTGKVSSADPVARAKGLLFFVLGAMLAVVAISIGIRTIGFIHDAESAPGVVVNLDFGGSHPQIAFTPMNGERVSYPQGGMIFGYKKGDRVRVLYYPKDPAAYPCIDDFGALWFSSMMPGFIGLTFLIVGFAQMRSKSSGTEQAS
jgi:hypothetical protein